MAEAIAVCRRGIAGGQSPFGAAIATAEGTLIHSAHNVVRHTCDCTAHAEINAIRGACAILGKIDLSGHVMATTCEPCPMCSAAIHWARLDAVYYGATIGDAEAAGFNELSFACTELYRLGGSTVEVVGGVRQVECVHLFQEWRDGPNPNPY